VAQQFRGCANPPRPDGVHNFLKRWLCLCLAKHRTHGQMANSRPGERLKFIAHHSLRRATDCRPVDAASFIGAYRSLASLLIPIHFNAANGV
jgi:hypothetical protein